MSPPRKSSMKAEIPEDAAEVPKDEAEILKDARDDLSNNYRTKLFVICPSSTSIIVQMESVMVEATDSH